MILNDWFITAYHCEVATIFRRRFRKGSSKLKINATVLTDKIDVYRIVVNFVFAQTSKLEEFVVEYRRTLDNLLVSDVQNWTIDEPYYNLRFHTTRYIQLDGELEPEELKRMWATIHEILMRKTTPQDTADVNEHMPVQPEFLDTIHPGYWQWLVSEYKITPSYYKQIHLLNLIYKRFQVG